MRIIARFEKREEARFVSHLDVQRAFQRAFRRAGIPLAYSQGFNPHPILAFATALAVGTTSSAEWLDLRLSAETAPEEVMQRTNAVLPAGFRLCECFEIPQDAPALTAMLHSAKYRVHICSGEPASIAPLICKMLSDPIVVRKRTKSGWKDVDIRPMIFDMSVETGTTADVYLNITGCLNSAGSLSVDLAMEYLAGLAGKQFTYAIHRCAIYSTGGTYLPPPPGGSKSVDN